MMAELRSYETTPLCICDVRNFISFQSNCFGEILIRKDRKLDGSYKMDFHEYRLEARAGIYLRLLNRRTPLPLALHSFLFRYVLEVLFKY